MANFGGGHVIGIDLGTYTIRACVFHAENRTVEVVPDAIWNCTPAQVSFTDRVRLVGRGAITLSAAEIDPKNTVSCPANFLGKGPHDEGIQDMIANLPFDVLFSGDQAFFKVRYRNQDICVTPQEVLAILLDYIKIRAEVFLKGKVTGVVIVVPSSFDRSQRNLVKLAAFVVGLQTVRILTGSVACAVVRHLHAHPALYEDPEVESPRRKILVIDIGARSTNVTLVESGKHDLRVRKTAECPTGGEHFTNVLFEYLLKPPMSDLILSDSSKLPIKLRRSQFWAECEKAKCGLSTTKEAEYIEIGSREELPGVPMIREWLEGFCKDLFPKLLQPIKQVLSGIDQSDIHEVVLSGGSSNMPMVQKYISRFFNDRTLWTSTEWNTLAARGAAIYAGSLPTQGKKVEGFSDILRNSLGFERGDGKFSIMLPRYGNLPHACGKTVVFPTANAWQDFYQIRIYEGEDKVAVKNRYLGSLRFPITPRAEREVKIKLDFKVTGSDDFMVIASEPGKETSHIMTTFIGDLDSEVELTSMRKKLEQFRKDARLELALSNLNSKHRIL
ncbi:actin-like ATPase domain-containing protein [Acephala macrosclerotiorum]|nr:actin-like ATPase domain-containing protein [Acephala macrosclerotiorum]